MFGGGGEPDSAERRRASYRGVVEKKLSVAERAVALNPSCVALQLERLRLCRELWEPAALAKEWKKLVGGGRVRGVTPPRGEPSRRAPQGWGSSRRRTGTQ